MEKIDGDYKLSTKTQDKAYFHSDTHINLAATYVKQILVVMIKKIIDSIEVYQKAGSANRYENRLTDLKQYENDLNTKGIDYPVKLKDITKFESLNPSLSGINVFSINDNNKFYALRMAQRNPQQTIDLFLHECDGKYHYSLIKNFSRLFRSEITSRTNVYADFECFTKPMSTCSPNPEDSYTYSY
ncbi:unnamed protein product [Porites lobata]|uniref:Uncharacterized protein n=1 Tax=Porites lobata TaxID=104759 RepID=A0ABN8NWJ5_9CNID|nr:unnamed protein product [Porites lobata]